MPYALKEKQRESSRRWAQKNRLTNRDSNISKQREWRFKNREYVNLKRRQWRAAQPKPKLSKEQLETRDKTRKAAATFNLIKANRNSHTPEVQAKRTASLQSSEKAKAAMIMVGEKYKKERVAAALKNPRYASTTKHALAKTWRLRSPSNVTYEFRNVVVFVRDNPRLFSEYQLGTSSKSRYCRAVMGLQSLCQDRKKHALSWYGWVGQDFK